MDSLLKGRSLEDLEEAVVDDGAALAMQQLHEMQIDALKLEPKYKVLFREPKDYIPISKLLGPLSPRSPKSME